LLVAQNDNSDVVKLDKNGHASVLYQHTHTGGALSRNKHGVLFIDEREFNPAVWELAPQRRLFANRYRGDPMDCLGLSADEKTLYVTNAGTLVAFDVQPDGSLGNQRTLVTLPGGGGDGSTIDAQGRIYVSASKGIVVVSPDGNVLGTIPTPLGVISVAFSGVDKKTLYAVVLERNGRPGIAGIAGGQVVALPMIAQGYRGRAK
jgi:hypothetical protein